MSTASTEALKGVIILGRLEEQGHREILSAEAVAFVAHLHRAFNATRMALLQRRVFRQQELHRGVLPDFLPETKATREDDTWKCAPPAKGLVDRRVEITGPVDRKMVINALNSGAAAFMADFEDSNSPTWDNNLNGQVNLRDAVCGTINFVAPNGKHYKLREDGQVATLIVRPRGWHLDEKHLQIDGQPCSASIFDFGLYFFHNAHALLKRGWGPYFYLPKMESHLEARLWNDIFNLAQDIVGLPHGTIRATVLIETILAAFEMDEILYELREHSSGLNCGRWDYIFSVIKKFRLHPSFVLPDRADITMTVPFMDAYVRLLIKTCHRRGVHAMGGMAAQIPIKDNEEANKAALEKVRQDKLREVKAGHDGTWVAHPALVPIAKEVFDANMPHPNQLYQRREDVRVTALDLLNMNVSGGVTEPGIRSNLAVSLIYVESWLRGSGCVPINNLMEDAATAEISRSQLWQWVRHQARTSSGHQVTADYVLHLLDDELAKVEQRMGNEGYSHSKFPLAKRYVSQQVIGSDNYADFITSLCYDEITTTMARDPIQGNQLWSKAKL